MPSNHSGEEDTEFKTELLDDTDSEPKEVGTKTSQGGKAAPKNCGNGIFTGMSMLLT